MKEYEVIVTGRFNEFFESENEETAAQEVKNTLPHEFMVDNIEVIEL